MIGRQVLVGLLAGGLALTLIACGDDDSWGDDDDGGFATESREGANALAPSTGEAAPDSSAGGADDAYGSDGTGSLAQLDRKIIFTATMTLSTEDVSGTFNQASILARTNGGYIESSNFTGNSDPELRSATLTVRVPVENYEDLLASLRSMNGVTVESEGSNSSEVTEQYTDLSSRLRNLERTEQTYLELLARANTIDDILTVQDRLAGVREQIEQIQGRLNVLDNMTDFATVSMTFKPFVAKVEEPKGTSGAPSLSSVWETSWERSLEVARYVAAAGVVVAVAAAWLVVPLALVVLAARRFRKPAPPVTTEVPAPQ